MTPHESILSQQPRLHRPAHSPLRVPVAVSPTHVHLTAATIEELFCDHYRLHEHSRLGQPALYEAGETVTLIGPRGHLDHVRVIGPPRTENQVEISSTDAQILGISAPARRSGEIVETPGIVIKGPRTSVRLHHGVIRALRHLHMNPRRCRIRRGPRWRPYRSGDSRSPTADTVPRRADPRIARISSGTPP